VSDAVGVNEYQTDPFAVHLPSGDIVGTEAGMGRLGKRTQQAWGAAWAAAAAWFAVWMRFFPQFVPTHFAWDAQPRFAQVVIGAGYIFRTAFFLNVAFEKDWLRLRWIVWRLDLAYQPDRRLAAIHPA